MRTLSTLLIAALVLGCAGERPPARAPLVNATPSDGAHPAVGALHYEGTFEGMPVDRTACTGTLIAPDVVLTAAHCLDPYITDMVGLPGFVLADDATGTMPPLVRAERAILHEGYVSRVEFHVYLERPHDVALLILEAPIDGVAPAEIAATGDVPELGDAVEVVGYGQTVVGDDGTVGLERTADAAIAEVGDTEIRFTDAEAPIACIGNGDSGGPIFDGERIVGAISHAGSETFCAGDGDVAERIDVYADWIVEHAPSVCDTSPRACPTPDAGIADAGPVPTDGGCRAGGRTSPIGAAAALLAAMGCARRRAREKRSGSCRSPARPFVVWV